MDHISPCLCPRFSYEEEASPQDFFVPLVWSLIVSDSLIPWQHSAIALFASDTVSRSYSEAEERLQDSTPQKSRDKAKYDELSVQTNGLDIV